jgi:phytoene dehydrogenase-like protein
MQNGNGNNSVIIIGGGFAGLSAGIYAQMNGYGSQIFEMQDKPGGLCTSWQRKGFTIDGCIHWLVGSNPSSNMHDYWEEVGIVQGREFINMDEYAHFEGADGRTLTFYTDIDKLEKHLLEYSPRDAGVIKELISGIKMCLAFDQPSRHMPPLNRLMKQAKVVFSFIRSGRSMQKWMKISCSEFARRFSDPLLRKSIEEMWIPEFSMLFMLFTFAYLHKKNAGYPIGGSMPMSEALEKRYLALEGTIHYNKRVEKILTEGNRVTGIRLDDGTVYRASRVISAADGYTTIFKMLDGKFTDENIRNQYDKWPLFPPLIYAGIGVSRTFDDLPKSVSGFSFPLKKPVEIADSIQDTISVHIYNHDPSMAPAGKTSIVIMLPTGYEYWKKIAADKAAYVQKKEEVGKKLIEQLEQRFPGISSQVEMINIATPLTFERYTGNRNGTFEGWLITPDNAGVVMKPLSQKLPGLSNFYLCGQWIEPGGGLPTGVMSARRLFKSICREDKKKFITFTP